jgi:hypothetical protein
MQALGKALHLVRPPPRPCTSSAACDDGPVGDCGQFQSGAGFLLTGGSEFASLSFRGPFVDDYPDPSNGLRALGGVGVATTIFGFKGLVSFTYR